MSQYKYPSWRGDPKLEMDTSGHQTDPYHSQTRMYDDQGWPVPFSQHPSFRPPIFVNVESSARNHDRFPDPASFELHFDIPLKGIASVEIVELYVPNVDVSPPQDNYFFVANGLLQNGSFVPQTDGIGRFYKDMHSDGKAATAPLYGLPVGLACKSFGKFCYDNAKQSQCWERHNLRKVHFFKPEIGKLGSLQFSLLDRNGARYDLATTAPTPVATDDNWSCTLMITTRMD